MVEQPTHNRQVRGSDPHPSHQLIPIRVRATVRDYIRAHQIFEPGPVVVAVSGGRDSTALLLVLADLADELGLVLHVAHFDHRVRGRQSAEDADFVAKLANRVGAPIRAGRADRPTKSEDDARRARYAFLRRAAAQIGATAIATGHTKEDQAETVLLHLVRGSGIAGLAGMRPLRDGIARPLLAVTHEDTAAVCRGARVQPRTDPSNRSLAYARNRVRHKVLPELAKLNPRVVDAIARLADAAAERHDAEQGLIDAAVPTDPHGPIELGALTDDALRADVLAEAWLRATGNTLTRRHRDALARLAASSDGTRAIDLPGGRAIREYGILRIAPPPAEARLDPPTSLRAGDEIDWNGWRIAVGTGEVDGAYEATVPLSLLRKLVVRSRRSGDRIAEGGKLQDLFTDAKIPAPARAKWPVLATDDAVWWVPGLTLPPASGRGTRLAVAAPKQTGNVLWTTRVRQVASNKDAVAERPYGGPRT